MKRRLALVLAGATALSTFGLGASAAFADALIHTQFGSAGMYNGGIALDGASTNPAQGSGYIIIYAGKPSCGASSGPYNDDGTEKTDDPSTPTVDEGWHDPGTCP